MYIYYNYNYIYTLIIIYFCLIIHNKLKAYILNLPDV